MPKVKKERQVSGSAVYNCWNDSCNNRWSAVFTEKIVKCPRCGGYKVTRDV